MAGDKISRIAVIGTRTIGASWTAVFLARGLTVAASDPAPGAETFLHEFVAAVWPSLARLSPLPAELPWAALTLHTEPEAALAGAELVQESAPEREALKRALLAQLDAVLDPEIVIASSSSGLLMSRLKIDCRHPERCVIGHPFNPPHLVAEGVASVADVDTAISAGPGLRWVLMGPHLTVHLAGRVGGIDHFLDQFAAPMANWWESLGNPTLASEFKERLAAGIAAETSGPGIAELAAWRDRFLVDLLALRAEQK